MSAPISHVCNGAHTLCPTACPHLKVPASSPELLQPRETHMGPHAKTCNTHGQTPLEWFYIPQGLTEPPPGHVASSAPRAQLLLASAPDCAHLSLPLLCLHCPWGSLCGRPPAVSDTSSHRGSPSLPSHPSDLGSTSLPATQAHPDSPSVVSHEEQKAPKAGEQRASSDLWSISTLRDRGDWNKKGTFVRENSSSFLK